MPAGIARPLYGTTVKPLKCTSGASQPHIDARASRRPDGGAVALLAAALPALCMMLLSAAPAHAEIYRYLDENGTTTFTDVPPSQRYRLAARGQRNPASARASFALVSYSPALQSQYAGHIQAAASAYNVDPALIQAVISVESGYDRYARSNRGALGLMQLMPETAIRYGVTNRLDAQQSIQAGARYLRDLKLMFHNDLELVIAAYNAGEHAVARHGNRVPPYPETADYVPRVLAYYRKYRASS